LELSERLYATILFGELNFYRRAKPLLQVTVLKDS